MAREPPAGARTDAVGREILRPEMALLLSAVVFFFVLASIYTPYSPRLRWALLVTLLLLGAWIAGKFVYGRTQPVPPLSPYESEPPLARGRLGRLAMALHRGNEGRGYSQLLFALALRDAFLARVRAQTDFQGDSLDLGGDLSRFEGYCEDPEIARFVRWITQLERNMSTVLSTVDTIFPERPPFWKAMEGMLERMEAWP